MKYLLFLLLVSPVHAISLDCNDTDTIFCMDLAEGSGDGVFDRGVFKSSAQLYGGPAWVRGSASRAKWAKNLGSTNTYAMMTPSFLQFTKTIGEEVLSTSNTIADFSGNKPGMMALIFYQSDRVVGIDNSVFAYGTRLGGFKWLHSGFGGCPNKIVFQVTVVANLETEGTSACNAPIDDLNPHSYAAWWDGQGNFAFYRDGKLRKTHTGVGDFVSEVGGQMFTFAKTWGTGAGEWSGGVCCVRIWKKAISRPHAEAFFKAYHESFLGAN